MVSLSIQANPIKSLIERISPHASKHFILKIEKSNTDFFELSQQDDKIKIVANSYVNQAVGLNWYLKYYAKVHISWNNMNTVLPEVMPKVTTPLRKETTLKQRFYLNYCTFSYSMAFWDWKRWEKEIDWMALHGINLSYALVGTESIWYNVLSELGYSEAEINNFIAGPGFLAWWMMNNMEAWGGPNYKRWYSQQATLQKKILKRMKKLGIEPILAGYAGMLPSNARKKLDVNVSDPGKWCAYNRPAFLQPSDPSFKKIADLYYKEMKKLYGTVNYYSMDPFHEGGNTHGVNLEAAGKVIMDAMKRTNPKATWVIQAWQNNPREALIHKLKKGDLLVLDLFTESRPQCGFPKSTWYRKDGFLQHDWLQCMLLNFGGNVGLHGKMKEVIRRFYAITGQKVDKTRKGIGLAPEGIENNPMMYELYLELPWRKECNKEVWLKNYLLARYGRTTPNITKAWEILSNTIYACPPQSTQAGPTNSIFCARPGKKAYQASAFAEMYPYYKEKDIIDAARLFMSDAKDFKGNNNFEYDLVDIVRQAIAEKGRLMYKTMIAAYNTGDVDTFNFVSSRFLNLILQQDELLSTRPEFGVGRWLEQAKSIGETPSEKKLLEWNARTQITTWGNRTASEKGQLRDYAHKEWSGILKDVYYVRWSKFIQSLQNELMGKPSSKLDFYAMAEAWTVKTNQYQESTEKNTFDVIQKIFKAVFE